MCPVGEDQARLDRSEPNQAEQGQSWGRQDLQCFLLLAAAALRFGFVCPAWHSESEEGVEGRSCWFWTCWDHRVKVTASFMSFFNVIVLMGKTSYPETPPALLAAQAHRTTSPGGGLVCVGAFFSGLSSERKFLLPLPPPNWANQSSCASSLHPPLPQCFPRKYHLVYIVKPESAVSKIYISKCLNVTQKETIITFEIFPILKVKTFWTRTGPQGWIKH